MERPHPTKRRLLEVGLTLLLRRGYNDLGIQALLAETGIAKGSFYHHFADKEDFALQIVDRYMLGAHGALDAALCDPTLSPLARVRRFFELIQRSYRDQGYMGCLLGGLGQELSRASEAFRRRIDRCFVAIADRLAACLKDARDRGDLSADTDPRRIANLLVDCWEGAALRSRVRDSAAPLDAMLDFFFESALRC